MDSRLFPVKQGLFENEIEAIIEKKITSCYDYVMVHKKDF